MRFMDYFQYHRQMQLVMIDKQKGRIAAPIAALYSIVNCTNITRPEPNARIRHPNDHSTAHTTLFQAVAVVRSVLA